jgi:hypothetical protein
MNYDESTVERFCSANNFCGMPMWLKYQNYLFPAVEEKFELFSFAGGSTAHREKIEGEGTSSSNSRPNSRPLMKNCATTLTSGSA